MIPLNYKCYKDAKTGLGLVRECLVQILEGGIESQLHGQSSCSRNENSKACACAFFFFLSFFSFFAFQGWQVSVAINSFGIEIFSLFFNVLLFHVSLFHVSLYRYQFHVSLFHCFTEGSLSKF